MKKSPKTINSLWNLNDQQILTKINNNNKQDFVLCILFLLYFLHSTLRHHCIAIKKVRLNKRNRKKAGV